ncbi:CLUMA_CG009249, isoform A [Clunio marinus]|uniref:CLUMA_CG009249, isoform A n=1 Tax=Clunio marinus TaxID=568069 RepID=A0A1J1I695_9DIPT|nr:CLUMA_CG009249, isoform A [Clunio marinus]
MRCELRVKIGYLNYLIHVIRKVENQKIYVATRIHHSPNYPVSCCFFQLLVLRKNHCLTADLVQMAYLNIIR